MSVNAKRILVTPLDWGLGHATRCIPIIRLLLEDGHTVVIGGHGASLELLRQEFPLLTLISLPGYDPRYPRDGMMVTAMLKQLPRFMQVIKEEHEVVENIIAEYNIDVVISDNRFGCWSRKAQTVFITHQSNILMPRRFGFLSPLVKVMNSRQMNNFDVLWIPDMPGTNSLSGSLISFGKLDWKKELHFIGHLSRFRRAKAAAKYEVVAVCSGPEPQRSILEEMLLPQLKASGRRFVLVRGLLNTAQPSQSEDNIIDFLNSQRLETLLNETEMVIARSGFSTVMDLSVLGKKAIFIPTPGQTEQEYLARRLKEMKIAFYVDQNQFVLTNALEASVLYSGFKGEEPNTLLRQAVDKTLLHA
jgi:UDP:flavonoid glycosyltransferase YjiC (YdhE family)